MAEPTAGNEPSPAASVPGNGSAPANSVLPHRRGSDPVLLSFRVGRWRWPWAAAGTLLVMAGSYALLFAADPLEAWVARAYGGRLEGEELVAGRLDSYLAFLTFALALIVPVALALTLVHRVSWRTPLGPDGRFAWALFWRAAGAWALVTLAGNGIELLRTPASFALQPHTWSHVWWVALAVLVILPQAFGEDLVFKGYLTRVWGAVVPVRVVILAGIAVSFSLLHASNEDVAADRWFNLATFVITEIVAVAVYLRTQSLAATTGMHWANNVIAICLINTEPGRINPFALAVYRDPVLMAGGSRLGDAQAWLELAVTVVVLWVLLVWRRSPFHLPSAPLTAAPPPARAAPSV